MTDLGAYHGWLYKTAADLLPDGLGDPALDDLVQEGRIAMWKAMDSYDEAKGTLAPWLTNAARQRMRGVAWGHDQMTGHEAMRGSRPVETSSSLQEWTDPDNACPHVWLPELSEPGLMDALAELDDEEREYVFLRFWGGLDLKTLCPPGTGARSVQVARLIEKYPVIKKRWIWARARKRLAEDPRVKALR